MTLRETITNFMVNVHDVRSELAAAWVAEMDESELLFRFRMYSRRRKAEVELSAEGPPSRTGDVSSTRFSRPVTMTAGLSALNSAPDVARAMPDSEVENRVRKPRRFCRGPVPDSERENRGKSAAKTSTAGKGSLMLGSLLDTSA
jgi:hypothetical protein